MIPFHDGSEGEADTEPCRCHRQRTIWHVELARIRIIAYIRTSDAYCLQVITIRRVALLVALALACATPAAGQPADTSIAALMQQATEHMAVDEWDEAALMWSRVIAEDSTHVVAHLNRAMSRYRAGDCEGRNADARQALRLLDQGGAPGEMEEIVYRAQAHGHLLQFDETIRLLEQAADRYPDSRPVSITLRQMRRRASGDFDWTCPPRGS